MGKGKGNKKGKNKKGNNKKSGKKNPTETIDVDTTNVLAFLPEGDNNEDPLLEISTRVEIPGLEQIWHTGANFSPVGTVTNHFVDIGDGRIAKYEVMLDSGDTVYANDLSLGRIDKSLPTEFDKGSRVECQLVSTSEEWLPGVVVQTPWGNGVIVKSALERNMHGNLCMVGGVIIILPIIFGLMEMIWGGLFMVLICEHVNQKPLSIIPHCVLILASEWSAALVIRLYQELLLSSW